MGLPLREGVWLSSFCRGVHLTCSGQNLNSFGRIRLVCMAHTLPIIFELNICLTSHDTAPGAPHGMTQACQTLTRDSEQ